MSDIAIRVEKLSKAYRLGVKEERHETLVAAAASWLAAPARNLRRLSRLDTHLNCEAADDILWALKDVSFDVRAGEVVGVIGRNGAGKSTLLKILSRITEPTSGRAVIHGRVSSLLEVGTGFHPEMTGRENVYMNGTILGMTKREIDRKFDEIVDFSGVEKFLDTPTKRYSSGMTVRLAFAVAAHLEPEILIIDEVLAVGDAEFQKKCLGKMQDVAHRGRTVLFVSHNMAAVESLCGRVALMANGHLVKLGETTEIIESYRQDAYGHAKQGEASAFTTSKFFKDAMLIDRDGHNTTYVPLGSDFHLRVVVNAPRPVRNPQIGIGIDAVTGQRMLTVHTPRSRAVIDEIAEEKEIHCLIPQLPLAPGQYSLKLALTENREELEVVEPVVPFTVTNAELWGEGRGFHRGVCVARSEWWDASIISSEAGHEFA